MEMAKQARVLDPTQMAHWDLALHLSLSFSHQKSNTEWLRPGNGRCIVKV